MLAAKQITMGPRAEAVCRKIGSSQATLYNGKTKYGGLSVSVRRLEPLQVENTVARSSSPT